MMVATVGDDGHGKRAIKALMENFVDSSFVSMVDGGDGDDDDDNGEPTGTAVVLVDEGTGENRIVLNPGANRVWPAERNVLPSVLDVAVFQLEIPLETVRFLFDLSRGVVASCLYSPRFQY